MNAVLGKIRNVAAWRYFDRAVCVAVALLCVNFTSRGEQEFHIPGESDAMGAKILETPEFKAFIDKYIAAVNAKDRKGLRALYDPVSQAAMAKDEKDAGPILDQAMEDKIPAKHDIVVSMIGPKEPLMFEEMGAVYAVRPIALAQINYSTGENSSGGTVIFLAPSGGAWYEVWTKPPDEKKMEAAMQGAQDAETQKEQGVKASGVTDFQHDAQPKDEFTKPYRWIAHLTEADSKDRKYEVIQIDQLPGGTTKKRVLVESGMVQPDHGTYGLQVGLSDKTTAGTGNVAEMFGLQEDISVSCIDASNQPTGVGASAFVSLPGSTMTGIDASPNGTPLTDGTLRFARYHSTNARGGAYLTDVVLREADAGKVAESKHQSQVQWRERECSSPLYLPDGYLITEDDIGKYRVFQEGSAPDDHQVNCIRIVFASDGALDPASAPGARAVPFKIKGQQFQWRIYKTEANGKPMIRKELIMPNILPRNKDGAEADYIWVRIDAATQEEIDTLTPVAGGIIRDSL